MGFTLDKVVPWGRSYDEYVAMFDLNSADLTLRMLGCGDGPAGFNAELTRRGGTVTSVDPIYAFEREQIEWRILATYETVMAQMKRSHDDYVWTAIPSVDELGSVRMSAMNAFLSDYDVGRREGRYVAGELPALPIESGSFDIALSSHFLFLYSAHLPAEFHIQAVMEMLRVAREARVFPLLTLEGTESPHLGVVSEGLERHGYAVERRHVPYEFQRGGNEMLRVHPV